MNDHFWIKATLGFAAAWALTWSCAAGTVMNTNDVGPGSLRDALANAAAGEVITFDTALAGKKIELTSGQITLTRDVVIDASTLSNRITVAYLFRSELLNWNRVFKISPSVTVSMNSVWITGGFLERDYGAGVFNLGALTMTNCVVAGNQVFGRENAPAGGGIWNGRGARFTALSTTVSGNFVDYSLGGGIYNEGGGLISLVNCTVQGNASDRNGGGIFNEAEAFLSLVNCAVNSNTGSGIYNAAGGTLWVDACVFSKQDGGKGEQFSMMGRLDLREFLGCGIRR